LWSAVPSVPRTKAELAGLRRSVLLYARSFQPGSDRNLHLRIAQSLGKLFKNAKWRETHVVPESHMPTLPVRHDCPRCQARSTVQHMVPSRSGFEHWTLRCIECGHIHQAQVHTDPISPMPAAGTME
jgi:hypothetical protein